MERAGNFGHLSVLFVPRSLRKQGQNRNGAEALPQDFPAPGVSDRIFRRLFWILLTLMALRLIRDGLSLEVYHRDADDMLRLAMLRDWLDGQGWFDYVQHRMLADGVSLHWSRYIDAGLAVFLLPLSRLLPQEAAETITMILWPGLLYGLLIALSGLGTRRLLGAAGGIAAMICTLFWAKLAHGEFTAGRIDHHNVQILGCSVMLFAFGVPQKDHRAGLRAGVFAACGFGLSLSAGLEMLPPMLLIWFTAGLRLASGDSAMRPWLSAFVISAAILLPLLMIGQTAPEEWLAGYCDELAPPVLLVVMTGSLASLLGVRAAACGLRAGPVILIMLGAVALGFALASPLLAPCLAGPYSDMTAEARALIPLRIFDTQPAPGVFLEKGEVFDLVMLPLLVGMLGAGGLGVLAWREMSQSQRWMLILCLGIAALGVFGSLKQFRAMNMAVSAFPFLGGFIAARLLVMWQNGQRLLSLLALLAVVIAGFFPAWAMRLPREMLPDPAVRSKPKAVVRSQGSCLQRGGLQWLDRYPPALIASSTTLGMPLLLETHHSITAVPYHRSGVNFWNGYDPFVSEPEMLALIARLPVGYVLICRSESVGDRPFAADLQNEHAPLWLEPESGVPPQFLLFRVTRPAGG